MKNKTLVEMDRCLLQTKDMPIVFWVEVVYYANYLLNQVLTKEVGMVTPIEKWWGKNPLVNHLRTFVCVSRDHILYDYRKKLGAKSHACIMMSYYEDSRAYQLFYPVKKHIIIRRNVIFDEKSWRLGLLTSLGPSYSDLFDIIDIFKLSISLVSISTSLTTPALNL